MTLSLRFVGRSRFAKFVLLCAAWTCALATSQSAAENFLADNPLITPVAGRECPEVGQDLDAGVDVTPCFDDSSTRTWEAFLGSRNLSALRSTYFNSYEYFDIDVVDTESGHTGSVDAYNTTTNGLGSDRGIYYCVYNNDRPDYRCNHAHVLVSQSFIEATDAQEKQGLITRAEADRIYRSVWCHENGHSFGLLHQVADPDADVQCMEEGFDYPYLLGAHNGAHLRDFY